MDAGILNIDVSESAEIAFSTLNADDRRLVSAWFDHLKNWRNDDFIRSRSRALDDAGNFILQTSGDILVAFRIVGDRVTILSIFRREMVDKFRKHAEHISP